MTVLCDHRLWVPQQVITIQHGRRLSVAITKTVKELALLQKSQFLEMNIRPTLLYAGHDFGRVAYQKRMVEMLEKLVRPVILDIVRKILGKNRPLRCCGFQSRPDRLKGESRLSWAVGGEPRPQGAVSFIPPFPKGLVKALHITALAHHPLKSG